MKTRADGTEDKLKTSPVAIYKKQIAEQDRKIAELEERLAAAENRDGSLFDLRIDRADDIVRAITKTMTEHKGKSIAQGILDTFKKRSTQAG